MHDGILKIAVGASRFAPVWTNVEMPWSELVTRLCNVIRTRETMAEWDSCTPDQQGALKDVGGFVGGTLLDGLRKAPNILDHSVLTLDLDNIPQNVDPWVFDSGYEFYPPLTSEETVIPENFDEYYDSLSE